MSERSSRRRLRVRRRRKGETLLKALEAPKVVEPRGSSRSGGFWRGFWRGFDPVDSQSAEVVGHLGCCVVEAIGSAAVLLALLTVPAYLMMR